MRNIQHIGMQILRTTALVFVPVCYVCATWQGMKADTPELPRIYEFVTYFEITQHSKTDTRLKDYKQIIAWMVGTTVMMSGW